MKTYEEMAESVLRIGKEKRTAELRKRKILLTGGTVALCLLLAFGGFLAQRSWKGNVVPAVLPGEDGVPVQEPVPEPMPVPDPQTDGLPDPVNGTQQEQVPGEINGPVDPADRQDSSDGQEQKNGSADIFGPEGNPGKDGSLMNNYSVYYGIDSAETEPQGVPCYAAPDNGVCYRSPMVEKAIRELGPENAENAILQIKGYLFLNNAPCGEADMQVFAQEAERLERDAGISCGLVREEDGVYHLEMELTPEQAAGFPAGNECGWFLFFRDQPV